MKFFVFSGIFMLLTLTACSNDFVFVFEGNVSEFQSFAESNKLDCYKNSKKVGLCEVDENSTIRLFLHERYSDDHFHMTLNGRNADMLSFDDCFCFKNNKVIIQ